MLKRKDHVAVGWCMVKKRSQNAQPQKNEILCSKELGALPSTKQAERKITEDFLLCRLCINTGIYLYAILSLNQNNFGITILTIT